MKQVLNTLYGVCEDGNYQQHFCKLENIETIGFNAVRGEPTPFKLYRVTSIDSSVEPVMVLAESPTGAIRQATCEPGRSYEEQLEIEKTLVAEIVPFKIRGWSSNRF
jgi:hypothetical protein